MRKPPKETFSLLRSILPHTAKNSQTSIDAFRWALRLKASPYADELYAALSESHRYTKK